MPPSYSIKQNDRRPFLRAVLIDSLTGRGVSLTGATVKFLMSPAPGSTATVNATATIVDASAGVVEYQWAAGDTANAGLYRGEFQVTYGDGRTETFPNNEWIDVNVRSEIGS